jgi:hypothetical protein
LAGVAAGATAVPREAGVEFGTAPSAGSAPDVASGDGAFEHANRKRLKTSNNTSFTNFMAFPSWGGVKTPGTLYSG